MRASTVSEHKFLNPIGVYVGLLEKEQKLRETEARKSVRELDELASLDMSKWPPSLQIFVQDQLKTAAEVRSLSIRSCRCRKSRQYYMGVLKDSYLLNLSQQMGDIGLENSYPSKGCDRGMEIIIYYISIECTLKNTRITNS